MRDERVRPGLFQSSWLKREVLLVNLAGGGGGGGDVGDASVDDEDGLSVVIPSSLPPPSPLQLTIKSTTMRENQRGIKCK
jgi:hypothetical protein